ncbi:T9SS type A sorting domain-containing protein [Hymenobacter sp. ASUV-10]|uniref:T9SS type A sorting domain-containing protein n=1 Tax=Hymenobacter aranciens TaxID=3063996 RepID=A0ABT9BAI5_9BACT|nr:T9SS type A sorting domain-containing protein [Hymenobacter sp. ASUV-10]MDO7875284.1 T9SS type A sorting domain-containing protein [Hymenobacter sp. ASUV-10]
MITRLLSAGRTRGWALALGLLGGLGAAPAAQAQAWNYYPAQATNTAGFYASISGGTVISTSNTDNANSAPQNIGFPFFYNGTTFTQFVLNTNGIMRLGSSAPSVANLYPTFEVQRAGVDPITSLSPDDVNLLAPFNFDLQASTATNAVPPEYRVATTGTAPNRVCTVQWKNVTDRPGATNQSQFGSFEFQVRLYETSNAIEFAYSFASYTNNPPASRPAVVGIKGLSSNEDILARKFLINDPWSSAVFFQGTYSGTNFNFRLGYGPDRGRTFRFEPRAATCAATTGSVGSITATAAQLTFAPVSGASSYNVVVTAPNGTTAFSQTVTTSPVSLTGLTANTAYSVSIVTNCAGGTTSAPGLVSFTTAAASGLANDECAGAIQLTPGGCASPTAGTTVGATQSLPAIRCGSVSGTADDDVWYKFTATGTSHNVTVVPGTGVDAVIDVRAGTCPGTNIGCADATAAGGTETATLAGLTVGTTYYVRVYSFRLVDDGPFTICVSGTAAPVCPPVAGLSVGGTTATGATLTFAPAAGASAYTVRLTPAGGTATVSTASGSPVSLSGLRAGTTYTVSVTTTCAGGQTSTAATTTFTTPAPAPTGATVSNITATGASLNFTPAAGASNYTVTLTPPNGPATSFTVSTLPLVLSSLLPGTNYTVTIVANYPGGATSVPLTTTFDTVLGTATRAALAGGVVSVFPNPTHRTFTLSLPALGATRTAQLTLLNALGQTVLSQSIALAPAGTQAPVAVAALAAGLYTVRVQAGAETATTRLAVE